MSNSNGDYNTALGAWTLKDNLSGTSNTAIGALALNKSKSSNNVAIGSSALYNNINGEGNVAIGKSAGYNETGSNKLYIENSNSATPLIYGEFNNDLIRINGKQEITGTLKIEGGTPGAGKVLTSDADGLASWTTPTSISVGSINGTSTANGATISAGVFSLAPADANNGGILTTGSQTIAGAKTFSANGSFNGQKIGKGNATGDSNLAVGAGALNGVSSGHRNTALGDNALLNYVGTSFDNNTSIGYANLVGLTTGSGNTSVGAESMMALGTGTSNTSIGNQSLINTTGSNNIGVGKSSGSTNTSGNNNTIIGTEANVGANNLSNATALGSGAVVATSNTIQLGNTSVTNVKTSGTITAGAITLPNTDGINGQVLTTNGSGLASWVSPEVSLSQLNIKEDIINKSIDVVTDATSNIKYPSVKAVKDYVDAKDTATINNLLSLIALLETKIDNLQNSNPVLLSFYPNNAVFCNSSTPTEIIPVTNPITGKTWMDRNLGATQVATSSTDVNARGDLYQWGRGADGHQCRNSTTTTVISNEDQPGNGSFIIPSFSPSPPTLDWRSPQNNSLWQGVNGINNPCPSGYRIPTITELNEERLSWVTNNADGAFASPLKLPMTGSRSYGSTATVNNETTHGNYYSSSIYTSNSKEVEMLYFIDSTLGTTSATTNIRRAAGAAIRCIKN